MESAIIWTLSIAIPAIITTVVGIILKRVTDKNFKKRDEEEAARRAEKEELEAFREQERNKVLANTIETSISKEIQPIKEDLALLKKGSQASLRHNIYEVYDAWIEKGYCPRDVKADFDNLYQNYHAMGKNGVMDKCYKDLMDLADHEVKSKK